MTGFEAVLCVGFLGLVFLHLLPWIAKQCRKAIEVLNGAKHEVSIDGA